MDRPLCVSADGKITSNTFMSRFKLNVQLCISKGISFYHWQRVSLLRAVNGWTLLVRSRNLKAKQTNVD